MPGNITLASYLLKGKTCHKNIPFLLEITALLAALVHPNHLLM